MYRGNYTAMIHGIKLAGYKSLINIRIMKNLFANVTILGTQKELE